MGPGGGGKPSGPLADEITKAFGDFATFQSKVKENALGQFGSGWAWLVWDGSKLQVIRKPNQDSPLMEGLFPVLGIDVWEHAYYLKYQNKRADYVDAWWNVVNWAAVAERFANAKAGK
jgi:Fe-Mn family superoxide dismutase